MDIHINFNEKSGEMDLNAEGTAGETSFIPDAGAPPTDVETSADENFEQADNTPTSGGEDLDIGGPAEWLVEAMANASAEENDVSDDAVNDSIDDGGSGPSE
ncbi:hypothetical protein LCGC14_1239190 [marine sediment metagenome]|uniref:Uncharacterized protein n=2 Tax=root TaxID=1 RepID=A0A831QS26_9FLAO|nr:hypothetical protein [Pricia antarctica]